MNFLAHAYLSFGNEEVLTGNMVSDFVKGKKQFDYPAGIREGITLHRQIDAFTDSHEVTRQAKSLLQPAAGRYWGAFLDVVYDHFLATDTERFANAADLLSFSENVYSVLQQHHHVLPPSFQVMFPYMRSQNWLYHYRENSGIEKSFSHIERRASFPLRSAPVFELFQKNYAGLQKSYAAFFPELYAFVNSKMS
jgi:acyl carrier protein phosphodiesterase